MFGAKKIGKTTFTNMIKTAGAKAMEFADNLEDGNSLGEKVEKAIARHINDDKDVVFILESIISDLEFPGELSIIPKVNDETLLIEKYALTTGGEVVIEAKDAKTLVKNLREIVLTDDDTKIKTFVGNLKTAYAKSMKA